MHAIFSVLLGLGLLALNPARAQELADTCHTSSSYDLTVSPQALVFDRADPPPRRIELRNGKLAVDGIGVRVNTEDADRLALFERELRALLPQVRKLGEHAVDLATRSVRAQVAPLDLSADTQAQLDRRLAAHGADLKRRIASSRSTHDWQGDAFDRYTDDMAADIVPLLAADLGTQAVGAALGGDLDSAAALRDRAAQLADGFSARIAQRMQALRPQIRSLCPSIDRLYDLQRNVRGSGGRPLGLLQQTRK